MKTLYCAALRRFSESTTSAYFFFNDGALVYIWNTNGIAQKFTSKKFHDQLFPEFLMKYSKINYHSKYFSQSDCLWKHVVGVHHSKTRSMENTQNGTPI